jgi:uncharacterized cupredoxin-like copper-binding protein
MKHRTLVVIIPALALFLSACSNSGASSVPSTQAAAPSGQASTGPEAVSVSLDQWAVTANTDAYAAGPVTFTATNGGTMDHEFVVLRTKTAAADIPVGSFEGEQGRINEDTAGTNVGETGDLIAGSTKTLTIDLKPGHYVFFCNLPGHYESGMHVDVTVT